MWKRVMHPMADAPAAVPAHLRPTSLPAMSASTARALPVRLMNASGVAWLTVAVLGQLLMAAYLVAFYGRAALQGAFERWNDVMPQAYAAGATMFNLVIGFHLLFAGVIIVVGALQLLPAIRRRAPALHRWSGRVYLIAAALLSIGGLLLVWVRGGSAGDLSQHVAVSGNALLILACAWMAWRHARARRMPAHRRWALRLFLAVSGVWCFRVGLSLWLVVNQGPAGFDPATFSGPFLTALAFAQYLLPLAVLELFLRVQVRANPRAQLAMAAGMTVLTLGTLAGIAAASMILWLPRM